MISINNLSAKIGNFSLQNITLDVQIGEYFVLLGPSGAGKTVFIETLLGLYTPDSGTIKIDGRDVTELPPEDRQVAYIPQDFGLFPHLSIRDNLLFGARARDLSDKTGEERMAEFGKLLEIEHLLSRESITSLSGGERQRVAIARALIVNPKVLFLDEPFSAIDEYLKHQLLKKLLEIKETLGVTIFHVTHDHHEGFFLGDRIGVILNGKIHQVSQKDDLYHRPQSIDVAKFLLTRNVYEGIVEGLSPESGEVRVRIKNTIINGHPSNGVKSGEPVYFGIRPEEIKIEPLPNDWKVCDSFDCNAMSGRIKKRIDRFAGINFEVEVEALPTLLEVEVLKTRSCEDDLLEGKEVKICLSRRALWVLSKEEKLQ